MSIINYTKGRGFEKNWLIEESLFDERYLGKCESIFAQGNGYLGLRNAFEERYVNETRDMFVAGSFNKAGKNETTELPNLPDIVNTEIEINGERFAMNRGKLKDYSRTLNLFTGETVRSLTWESPKGDCVSLNFRRFVSLDNVHVIGNMIEITALSDNMRIQIMSGIDAQVTNSGAQHFDEGDKRVLNGNCLEFPVTTSESHVLVYLHSVHSISADQETDTVKEKYFVNSRRRVHVCYETEIKKGSTLHLEKISSVHSSRDIEYAGLPEDKIPGELLSDSREFISRVSDSGYDCLFTKSCKAWEKFWREQDVQIEGNDLDQLSIRFALYHLQCMTRRGDNRIGIAAKGLTGEGYKGHSFWDTETFIFPYFQMTDPGVARDLLSYRYRSLYGARKKAAENGYAGAMYPWESAWITDGEVTPYKEGVDIHTGESRYCLTGQIEIHITADIIYALWQYYISTGDEKFMNQCGYEMILDTARFWNSRLEWVEEDKRYEIRDVIGPDEYKEHVDNNAYTNYLANYNMQLAVSVIDRLAKEDVTLYSILEEKLCDLAELRAELTDKLSKFYLPKPNPETGIIEQFDGYSDLKEIDLRPYKQISVVGTILKDYSHDEIQKMQAGKQADVIELLYLFEDLLDAEGKRKNYSYYEAKTLHDSSLSKAIHSIIACDLNLGKEAYEMFRKAADTDMGPEMNSSNAGIHSANMGGIWQDVVMGFGGLRISHEKLRINPHLPDCWRKLTFPIFWRGQKLKITIDHEKVKVENEGTKLEAVVQNRAVTIQTGINVYQK